jgi:pimeloyl-ACP methyl ester carboxylesterase
MLRAMTKTAGASRAAETDILKLQQTRIEVQRTGKGAPLLFLHGEDGYELDGGLIGHFAKKYEVFAPRLPGFGKSTLPDSIRSMDDAAYLWLDLIDHYGLEKIRVAGFSVGGWLALELATKTPALFDRLLLSGPLGLKFGGAYDRDIEDIYFHPADKVRAMRFHDPAADPHADLSGLSKRRALAYAREREAVAKLFWDPYFHNPSLVHRLNRARMPTLVVSGLKDGMTKPAYGRTLATKLPNAKFAGIPAAGHFPHIERPARFLVAADAFLAGRKGF